MRHITVTTLVALMLLVALSGVAAAKENRPPVSFTLPDKSLDTIDLRAMPAVDNAALRAEAERQETALFGGPHIFAHPLSVSLSPDTAGTWETLADGSRLWRLRVHSAGAHNLNLAFKRFDLPKGAALWVYNPTGDHVQGAYTATDRSKAGELWTAIVFGEEAVVELHVPAAAEGAVVLELAKVNHGFRSFVPKQGACNNDVACSEADPWRDQVRSVGWYTQNGIGTCSGQLVNNTVQDGRPFFMSANHCGITSLNDDSVVVYWNFESPVCGQLSGGSLTDNQSGAIFRASQTASDFLLFELQQVPAASSNVFYSGWDVTGSMPGGAVGIHHPNLDEKAISFDNDPLVSVDIGNGPGTHWQVVAWDDGTTEGGSSGSCIWDPVSKLCVGVLTGGFASCSAPDQFDVYGKLSVAWQNGLRTWLDPGNSGVSTLQGYDPNTTNPTACRPSNTVMCLNNGRFQVEMNWRDFDGNTGQGQVAAASTPDAGLFYFFDALNWEILVKVLNGCSFNGNYWVFTAGVTNVEWTLTVTDTQNGQTFSGSNPLGRPAPAITDTGAFATCP